MSAEDLQETYASKADTMERMEWLDHRLLGRYRRAQFGDADGRVLDVACGTGTNFRYLPPEADLVGIDLSPEMVAKARRTLRTVPVDGTVREMDATEMAFPDDEFDAVISAMSTCTFPDPIAVLREMSRVCKPDGRILLLEHGRSDVGPIARFQDWRADSHYEKMGCRWNQEPLALVRDAGLAVRESSEHFFGIVTRIEAEPDGG